MRLVDTHCHIQFDAYGEDRNEVLARAREEEVGLLVVGCDYESSRKALELACTTENIWAAVGQHPTDTETSYEEAAFQELAHNKKVVAIGECGLDYFRISRITNQELRITGDSDADHEAIKAKQQKQRYLFKKHIELARGTQKPLIIHCRDAHDDCMSILAEYFRGATADVRNEKREPGVLHCFTGTAHNAQSYLDLGFSISFTGIITFADQYDDVVRIVPLEKILLETDSPFLTPAPHRGKRNQPAYVELVARRVAELKGCTFEEVAHQTTENARRLFGL